MSTKNLIPSSSRLLIYHTYQCDPNYYWENNEVAIKLKDSIITSYADYISACKSAGCVHYNETVYNEYVEYADELRSKYGPQVQIR